MVYKIVGVDDLSDFPTRVEDRLKTKFSGQDSTSEMRVKLDSLYAFKSDNIINVKDYGAKGDGANDDAVAIQAAITVASNIGGTVFIPDGNYRLNSYLKSVKDGLSIRLSPRATMLRYHSNNMFLNGTRGETVKGHSNITIEGGLWDVRGAFNGDFGSCFAFGKAENIRVSNLTVKSINMAHVIEIAGCSHVIVDGVKVSGYMDSSGTRDYSEAFQIERMSVPAFPDFDIDDNTPSSDITITNCIQITPGAGYSRWPVGIGVHTFDTTGSYTEKVTLRNNHFGTCTRNVIRTGVWKNAIIDGNSGDAPVAIVISGDNNVTRLNYVVINNKFVSTGGSGIVVTQCKGVTIKSNDLQGSTNGIAIDTGEYCVISDNMLVADAFDAINLNTFKSVKISNNIIVSSRLGVQINGGSYDVIIDGNVFKTLTNHGIAFNDAAGNSVVSNNRFTFMPTGNRVVNFSATAGKVGINANMYPSSVTTFQNGTGSQALLGTNYPI